MGSRSGESFLRLVEVMARLRMECPWDRSQTSRSILPYLVEEAYEAVEAIESGRPDDVRDELGDLLLQVLFHSELASERGEFDVFDVIEGIREKMVRRHPHVFADGEASSAEEVRVQWARIKATERQSSEADEPASVLDGVPASMPALLRAQRIGEKAARIGFDWDTAPEVFEKIREETAELEEAMAGGDASRIESELGDLLLAISSLARHVGSSAEMALRSAVWRFETRFRSMERGIAATGGDPFATPRNELERLWELAKKTRDAGN